MLRSAQHDSVRLACVTYLGYATLAIAITAPLGATGQAKPDKPRATATPSRLSEAHYQRGIAALARSESQTAIHEFLMALRVAPKSPEGHNGLGQAYFLTGQFDKAAIQYRKAIALC